MSDVTVNRLLGARGPEIRRVANEAPWAWLSAGWRDLWRRPGISLAYGLIFALVSAAITAGLWVWGLIQYLPPLAGGFMLVGPLLAVGLYEVSRRLERGERPGLAQALFVRTASPTQLGLLGLLLMTVLLSWMYAAVVLFSVIMGPVELPPAATFPGVLLLTADGLALLVIGTLTGAAMAVVIFAVSAISVPLLMERKVDVVTAVTGSIRAVLWNWKPMLLWAALIAAITACGLATLYIGLIVAFPLIGHATWHAYRDLVVRAGEPPA